MLFFVDIDCTKNDDVKSLTDVARVLKRVQSRVEELAKKGKGSNNIVEPILANDGSEVGEFEWLVDRDEEDFANKLTDRLVKLVDDTDKFFNKE